MPAKRTKIQETHFNFFVDVMRKLEWDLHQPVVEGGRIPDDWHRIAAERGPSPKIKLTLRVEGDVVKFFRSTGAGYQGRMNDVLRSWMHGRLAGLVKGPDAAETMQYLDLEVQGRGHVGDTALMLRNYMRQPDGTLMDQTARGLLLDERKLEAESVEELLEMKRADAEQQVRQAERMLENARRELAEVEAEIVGAG